MELPDPDLVAGVITAIVAMVVLWDVWLLWRRHSLVPLLGPLNGGGFAWSSTSEQEMGRHWSSLLALTFMLATPWILAESSGTSLWLVLLFDLLLGIHMMGLLVPKRYAITRTHLFCDGQSHEWENLRLAVRQPRGRILLHRRGWGIFAPLPLGGRASDLFIVRSWISAAMLGGEQWLEMCEDSTNESE